MHESRACCCVGRRHGRAGGGWRLAADVSGDRGCGTLRLRCRQAPAVQWHGTVDDGGGGRRGAFHLVATGLVRPEPELFARVLPAAVVVASRVLSREHRGPLAERTGGPGTCMGRRAHTHYGQRHGWDGRRHAALPRKVRVAALQRTVAAVQRLPRLSRRRAADLLLGRAVMPPRVVGGRGQLGVDPCWAQTLHSGGHGAKVRHPAGSLGVRPASSSFSPEHRQRSRRRKSTEKERSAGGKKQTPGSGCW